MGFYLNKVIIYLMIACLLKLSESNANQELDERGNFLSCLFIYEINSTKNEAFGNVHITVTSGVPRRAEVEEEIFSF